MDPLAPTLEITESPSGEVSVSPLVREALETVEIAPLQGMLDIDRPTPKEARQMSTVMEYLKSNIKDGETSQSELLYQFKLLESKLSMPRLGETRLGKIYNYVRADQEFQTAEKIRNEFLRA